MDDLHAAYARIDVTGASVRRVRRRPIQDGGHRAVAGDRRARTEGALDRRRARMRRRDFLRFTGAGLALGRMPLFLPGDDGRREGATRGAEPIDRKARVARHSPVVRVFDSFSALSVGNGGFAFTADATGLQTFPERYRELPLATQAEWGWHTEPNIGGYKIDGRVGALRRAWPTGAVRERAERRRRQLAAGESTPHLARARRLRADACAMGRRRRPPTSTAVEQRLDLWTGTIDSRFTLDGRAVRVRTWAHPERDQIAVRVESEGLDPSRIAMRIMFPFASATHTGDPADWLHAARHRTVVLDRARRSVTWQRLARRRRLLGARRVERRRLDDAGRPARVPARSGRGHVALRVRRRLLARARPSALPEVDATAYGERGALDALLERWRRARSLGERRPARHGARAAHRALRVSHRREQCAGTMPPQETGETFNSWFGKSHLEMHWWHAAHFALWNRAAMLERSLPWYSRILPAARANAARQGYRGRALAEDGRAGWARQPLRHRRVSDLAAAAPDLSGRARVSRASGSSHAGAISRDRVRVGRVHGVLPVLGCGGGAIRARAAAHPGAGEPSARDDLQSDLRARVLGVRPGDGADSGASGWGSRASRRGTACCAGSRRCRCATGVRQHGIGADDLHRRGPASRSSDAARRVRRSSGRRASIARRCAVRCAA